MAKALSLEDRATSLDDNDVVVPMEGLRRVLEKYANGSGLGCSVSMTKVKLAKGMMERIAAEEQDAVLITAKKMPAIYLVQRRVGSRHYFMDVYATGFRSADKAGLYGGVAGGLVGLGGNVLLADHFARKANGRKVRKMADAEDQYLQVLVEDVINPALSDPDVFNMPSGSGDSSGSGGPGGSERHDGGNGGGHIVDLPGDTKSLETPTISKPPVVDEGPDERARLVEELRKEAEEKARREAAERAREGAGTKARCEAGKANGKRPGPVLRQLAFVTREELTDGARRTFEVEGTNDGVTVDVAPGSKEGARIVVPGRGRIDRETGRRGDLELQLVVAPATRHHHHADGGHRASGGQELPDAQRGHISSSDQKALSVRRQVLLVTREELQNGAHKRIEVDETHERVSVDIAPGSRPGMRIRIPGYGREDKSTGGRGDLELQLVEM